MRSFHQSDVPADVIVAHDGGEALDYLFGTGVHTGRDLSVMPTRILLDLYLPKVNGLQVPQRIKADERTRMIPVTILTGSDYEVITTETMRQGAEGCVMKPVTCEGIRQIAAQSGLA